MTDTTFGDGHDLRHSEFMVVVVEAGGVYRDSW